MNVDQFMQRVSSREADTTDGDNIEDLGGFGLLRGIRDRAFAVELRKLDGVVLAIPYPLIENILFTPADIITIRAGGREIRIKGRGLNQHGAKSVSLFSALVRQRAAWIAEQPRSSRQGTGESAGEISVGVEAIIW